MKKLTAKEITAEIKKLQDKPKKTIREKKELEILEIFNKQKINYLLN